MEVALGNTTLLVDSISLVKSVRVKGLVGDNMIQQECLEVLLAVLAEQESVDSRAKFLESEI